MIQLSNGHVFEYMAASGALAFDGKGWPWEQPLRWSGLLDPSLFTVVTKTLTYEPRRGNLRWWNPFRCVRMIREGVVNAVGLTNPGIKWWCRSVGPTLSRRRIPVIVSFLSENIGEIVEMTRMVKPFNIVGIELNASCPNSGGDLTTNTWKVIDSCLAIKAATDLPLILKLSVAHDHRTILRQVHGCVEAVSINSVPWSHTFPDQKSPLAHFGGGGVSGPAARKQTWTFLGRISRDQDIPVIGPGVWEYCDMEMVRHLGAKAIGFGSIFLRYPWRPTLYARRDREERKKLLKSKSAP